MRIDRCVPLLLGSLLFSAGAGGCNDEEGASESSRSASEKPPGMQGMQDVQGVQEEGVEEARAEKPGEERGTSTESVPGEAVALRAWLDTRAYKSWAHESAPHRSGGPHGGDVQTYVDPILEASLSAGGESHPKGAAAVKELFTDGVVSGWAVLVKNREASDAGEGFYWYEVFDTAPGAKPLEGQGLGLCRSCHAGGRDFVLTPYPLR